jgi:hypothetical protein
MTTIINKVESHLEQNSDQKHLGSCNFIFQNKYFQLHCNFRTKIQIINNNFQIKILALKMNTDLVDTMNIDQSLLFAHDENEIILEVNKEDAKQLLNKTETPTTTTSHGTTPSSINIANDLTTINAKDFGSAKFPHLIMIKAAYAVRNVAFQNKTDSIQVATTTFQTRTNFHTRESWWAEQLKQAKTMIQQTTPYSWAKAAHVLELTNPHLYYFITGAHNCQVLKKIDLPLTPERLSLLPTPAHGPNGNFRIRISFTVDFGRQEHQHKTEAWKLVEPHI